MTDEQQRHGERNDERKPLSWHLIDRAYKMMEMAGYRVAAHDPAYNNPIIAWMADARVFLHGVQAPESTASETGPLRLDTDQQVFFYEQDHYYLSNFSAFKVEFDGRVFDTAEHAYHFQRFTIHEDRVAIICADSAHSAFRYAQDNKARQRPEWNSVKAVTMLDILRAKAEQHEYVRRKLLQTGERELVENSWRDDYWGWGPNRDGLNMLGNLWMEVRAELRASLQTGAPK